MGPSLIIFTFIMSCLGGLFVLLVLPYWHPFSCKARNQLNYRCQLKPGHDGDCQFYVIHKCEARDTRGKRCLLDHGHSKDCIFPD